MRRPGWRSTVNGGGAETFERFTERARQAVVLAQDEARGLGHAFIAPDHLFLGLLRESEGLAARVLDSVGVDVGVAHADVRGRLGEGRPSPPTGQIPFTAPAKATLEAALREALALGHNYIGTEHLLLGLTRVDDPDVHALFAAHGLTPDGVHEATVAAFASEPGSPWERAVDTFAAGEWRNRVEALERQGWEIVRVIVERRRRREPPAPPADPVS